MDDVLNSLNPTGSLFVEHDPESRASAPLGGTLTTLAATTGHKPDDRVMIYRGIDADVGAGDTRIEPGDYVTTNWDLAKSYAGTGTIASVNVRYGDVLDEWDKPKGEEYIYRPGADREFAAQALQKHLESDRLADFVSIDKLRVDRFYPDNDWAHTEDIHKDVALEALKNDGVCVLGCEYADKLFTRIDLGSPYVAQEVRDTVANDIMDALSGSEKMPLERAIACVNPCAMNFQAVEIVDKMGYEAAFCNKAELHKAQGPSLKESASENREASEELAQGTVEMNEHETR